MSKTIDEYEEQYKDFSRPRMYVKVEDKRVEDEELAYTFLTVEMSMGNEASYCKFTVISRDTSCVDDKLNITDVLKNKFKLGNKVDIYLGYSDDKYVELVFSGYVTSINFEYTGEEGVSYTIEAMDLKIFMMNNFRSEIKTNMTKYSAVVTSILSRCYNSLYTSRKVDETKEITSPIEQYNQSDYDFVVELARKVDYRFFVCKGVVNFIDYTKLKESIITISPNAYLYSLEREISISKQIKSVTVRTNDESDPTTPLESTVDSIEKAVGSGNKRGIDVIASKNTEMQRNIAEMKKTIIDNSVKSAKEAQERAQAELNRSAMDFVSGECELIGIPALEPGKFVTIKDIDKSIDGDYLITEIKHIFDDEGYKTIWKFGANMIKEDK